MNTPARKEIELAASPSILPATTMTPMEMIGQAINKGMGLEVIEKLMALEERFNRTQAVRSFNEAIADAKEQIKPITKNATGHNSKRYANFAAIAEAVDPILSQHGLGYRFRTAQDEKSMSVTCVLFHRAGHSEENTLSGPADTSGSKNAIQAIGSTQTYLMRYTLIQALGLAATEDDDGKGAGRLTGTVTDEQRDELAKLINESGTDIAKFTGLIGVDALADVLAKDFEGVKLILKQKKAVKDATAK